jgi:chromosome segregation ATPase
MDAIRKKMQTMKFDIDALYDKIAAYENEIKESNAISDEHDKLIRDVGKKVQKFETNFEEIIEKMTASNAKMDEAEKEFKDKDDDVNASARRGVLMEGEATVSVEKLATTVMKLALMSKEADTIIKGARHWESANMNNEMEIETLEVNLKEAKRIAADNEMKYDNLSRSLAMMQDELKRAEERVKIAEGRVVKIEDELGAIGENQKQLEISEEKARRREEKYQEQIKQIQIRLKESDSRSEYAEMNITKLHLRIDELEDEIIREKLKINAVSGQLDDTFNEMLNKY